MHVGVGGWEWYFLHVLVSICLYLLTLLPGSLLPFKLREVHYFTLKNDIAYIARNLKNSRPLYLLFF